MPGAPGRGAPASAPRARASRGADRALRPGADRAWRLAEAAGGSRRKKSSTRDAADRGDSGAAKIAGGTSECESANVREYITSLPHWIVQERLGESDVSGSSPPGLSR